MTKPYTTRDTCRACGSTYLTPLFSLGEQHVSDFVERDKVRAGVKVPIDVELCRSCTLVQAKHTAPQELLYGGHYWYRSGVTKTMRDALRDVAGAAYEMVSPRSGDVVLDIGSNDGTLLRCYDEFSAQLIKVGVEPASNLWKEGKVGVSHLVQDFWNWERFCKTAQGDPEMSPRGWFKGAKIITALGMAYDLEDPNQFFADVAKALAPSGVFVAQLMCLRNMLNVGDVGNFAHEHLEFYSLRSLISMFTRHGLEIFDLETNAVNGESYRLWVGHADALPPGAKGATAIDRVQTAWHAEKHLDKPETFERFFRGMELNKLRCREFLLRARAAGKKTWIIGASTKGNCIAQWYGLDPSLIEAACERSPEKVGKYTIGSGIPIKSEEEFRAAKVDYALVLPYTFRQEIMAREQKFRDGGGKFLIPLPNFEVA